MLLVRLLAPALALALAAGTGGHTAVAADEVVVTVNPAERYQKILGWGKCAPEQLDIPQQLRDLVLERAVDDLGLTRLRYEPPSGSRTTNRAWEWLNDDPDPYHINWRALSVRHLDRVVGQWVVPFKRRVEARGEPFTIYVSPSFFDHGSSGHVPAWLHYSPEEYAEYAMSILLRLKNRWGIEADYYCICNEAGNDNAFSPDVVIDDILALGRRVEAAGLKTKIQFPECVNANASWRYLQALQRRPEAWRYIGMVSYHLYGKNDAIPKIRELAWRRGLPTAQTEFMWLTMDHLYNDLVAGGVSCWEIYGLAGVENKSIGAYISSRSFRGGPRYWSFRQVLHYVRPGAVRIGSTCTGGTVKALAFEHGGRLTVVLINASKAARPATAEVRGLPPGEYAISRSVANRPYEELGVVDVRGVLDVDVPANAVVTIYPHEANAPPVVTGWYADPNFLTLPRTEVTLRCRAVDPERDPLTFRWRLVRAPWRARVEIADPARPQTRARGLSASGQYCFEVAVSDGRHTVTKRLWLTVFRDNQPPRLIDLHNRMPVRVRLPDGRTELRGGASDIDGDKLTYRWSIVRQPRGANARLEKPNERKCPVTGMDVPGDYVFRFTVSDGHHTVHQDHTVTVYPRNTPPRIVRAQAQPATVSAQQGRCKLSVQVVDDDGDPVTVYCAVPLAPAGAAPVVAKPGARTTDVTGLTVPGRYVFEVRAIDNADCTRQQATVQVRP